jgi:hypothetical protein
MTHLVEIRGLAIRFTGEHTSSYPPLEGRVDARSKPATWVTE